MESNEKILILSIVLSILSIVSIRIILKYRSETKQRKKLAKENKKLIAENKLFETEYLKFQLQPHTLNNILANLKTMASKLNKGMVSLSDTLEYILYKGGNDYVSIKDEIDFIKKYLQLNDLFITEIDSVKLDISDVKTSADYYNLPCIPHLISASFIENAFKHGDKNHPDFLKIKVSLTTNTFELKVINKTKHKVQNGQRGIGLQNMKKRLELLLPGNFDITNSCNEYEYHSILKINLSK